MTELYCAYCKKPATALKVDLGVGYTQVGSYTTLDRDLVFVSACCEDDLLTEQEFHDDNPDLPR